MVDRREFLAATSALLVAPMARAQQRARPVRLGVLAQSFTKDAPLWKAFFVALEERGWHEGAGYSLEIREAFGDPVRAQQYARELVDGKVNIVLALSTAAAVAARKATTTIPIVAWVGYPVEAGLAATLARPGGNVTGVAHYAGSVWGKSIELLRDLLPVMKRIGVLWDYTPPAFPDGLVPLPEIEQGARSLGITSRAWMVRSEQELAEALSAIERSPLEALVISATGGVHLRPTASTRIEEFVTRRRLPAITDFVFQKSVPLGCVLAYAPDSTAIVPRLAHLVDRVLRGADPGALPFELPSRFDLAISAKTASALGLRIPPTLLARATRVIE